MISPELLRKYPFFNFLDHEQLRQVAMITEEIDLAPGEVLFASGDAASALYLVQHGNLGLYYVVHDTLKTGKRRELLAETVNPGEVLGISALIDPYTYTALARADAPCRLLKVDAIDLRALTANDPTLAYGLQRQVTRAAMNRLYNARVQLAAANGSLAKA